MTDSQRPDGAPLSTADLAAASDKTPEQNPGQQSGSRPPADRDVTPKRGTVADVPERVEEQERPTPLFAENEADDLRRTWADIQTGFVDDPRRSVERADELVATAMKRMAEIFARERDNLERQWSHGGDASTEDLRVALRRYRGFFDRLLSV